MVEVVDRMLANETVDWIIEFCKDRYGEAPEVTSNATEHIIFVDSAGGDDLNSGRSRADAFATLGRARMKG